MKITKSQLTQLIREELEGLFNEEFGEPIDLGDEPLVKRPDHTCGPGGCRKNTYSLPKAIGKAGGKAASSRTYSLPKAIGKASGKFISHIGSYLEEQDKDYSIEPEEEIESLMSEPEDETNVSVNPGVEDLLDLGPRPNTEIENILDRGPEKEFDPADYPVAENVTKPGMKLFFEGWRKYTK